MELEKENWGKRIFPTLPFLLVSLFPVLPNALQSIVFGILIFSLFFTNTLKSTLISEKSRLVYLILLTGYYIWSLGTYFYSSPYTIDFKIIQSNFLLLVLPVLFTILRGPEHKNLKWVIYLFSIASLLFLVQLFFFLKNGVALCYNYYAKEIYLEDYIPGRELTYLFSHKFEHLHSLASWGYTKAKILIELNTHHAYISALLNLNIVLLLFSWHQFRHRVLFKLLMIITMGILAFMVVYIGSKINVVFLIGLVLFELIYRLFRIIRPAWLFYLGLSIVALIFVNQYYDSLPKVHIADLTKSIDSERRMLYQKLWPIVRSNLYNGIGINNVNKTVDSVMQEENTIYQYNVLTHLTSPHSQFLYYALVGGLPNLVLFVIFFLTLAFYFYKNKQLYGLHFVLLIFLNCIFEDFLNRVWGVYIFSFGLIILWDKVPSKYEV